MAGRQFGNAKKITCVGKFTLHAEEWKMRKNSINTMDIETGGVKLPFYVELGVVDKDNAAHIVAIGTGYGFEDFWEAVGSSLHIADVSWSLRADGSTPADVEEWVEIVSKQDPKEWSATSFAEFMTDA